MRLTKVALLALTIGISFGLLSTLMLPNLATGVSTGNQFSELKIEAAGNNLFDLGVTDFDRDGRLDVFTVAHHSQQSLLQGDGWGRFVDVLSDLGLDAQPQIPGIEIRAHGPRVESPGLYVYFTNEGLVIRWEANGNQSVRGSIEMLSRIRSQQLANIDLTVSESAIADKTFASLVRFSATGSGTAVMELEHFEVPIRFRVGDLPAEQIFLGSLKINPATADFELFLNDRHGMAWADLTGNGQLDVYVTRGGLRGTLYQFPEPIRDELMVFDSGRYKNTIEQSGIEKNGCPGYNVQWVDYNNNNLLDLYIVCHHGFPNQLHHNNGDGTFREVAAELGLAFTDRTTDTAFVWVATRDDPRLDLVISSDYGVKHLRRDGGRFELLELFDLHGVTKISKGDFNSNGRIDLLVSSYHGQNAILRNDGGRFTLIPAPSLGLPSGSITAHWVDLAPCCRSGPAPSLGLPSGSITAHWVDFDNDGRLDVFLVPGGLFRQDSSGQFIRTGLLDHRLRAGVVRARASWFDLDNNGYRDLVLAVNYQRDIWRVLANRLFGDRTPSWLRPVRGYSWDVRLFKNLSSQEELVNNWLQVELNGPEGNPQAIGATVRLVGSLGQEAKAQVGHAEGSHFSQGHYRIYFGLGDMEWGELALITRWPDGHTTHTKLQEVNRLITVDYQL